VFFSLYAGALGCGITTGTGLPGGGTQGPTGGGHPGIVGPGTGLPGGGPQGPTGSGHPGIVGPGTGLPGHGPQGPTGDKTGGPADFDVRRFRRQLSVGSPDRPCYTGTIRYDTKCYFNVRSKADMSQLNLPHGNNN